MTSLVVGAVLTAASPNPGGHNSLEPAYLQRLGYENQPSLGAWFLDNRAGEHVGDILGCPQGQRNAVEEECYEVVKAAATKVDLEVIDFKVVNDGPHTMVPAGCSYSKVSKMAIYNRNTEGRSHRGLKYRLACAASHTERAGYHQAWEGDAKEACEKQHAKAIRNFRTREQDAETGRLSMRGDDFRNASTAPSLMLVHVGHTCGSSVKQFLTRNDKLLNKFHQKHAGWAQVHVHPVKPWMVDGAEGVIITLRDPIDRLVSAYNTKACLDELPSSMTQEEFANCQQRSTTNLRADSGEPDKLAACFPNVTAYADGIDDKTDCGSLARKALFDGRFGHLAMGSCFYMGGLLNRLKDKAVHVINAETCEDDMQAVPKWLGMKEKQQKMFKLTERVDGDFPHHGDAISSEGRKRLQRHLAHEYALFGELQKLGKPF